MNKKKLNLPGVALLDAPGADFMLPAQLSDAEEAALPPEVRRITNEDFERAKARMSPPGTLGLHPRVEALRLRYMLVDEIFIGAATYDRIHVYQCDHHKGNVYGDSGIIMTDTQRVREQIAAPFGFILSAGLQALDTMRAHGMELGDVVAFSSPAAARVQVGFIGSKALWLMVMHVGDICSNHDTQRRIRKGEIEVIHKDDQYRYRWNGTAEPSAMPKDPRVIIG
jgi:hypothetical protein